LVHARLDEHRRQRHMRFHTATHLLCALVPHPVDGCSITAGYARLDFHMTEPLDKEALTAGMAAWWRGAPGPPPAGSPSRTGRQPRPGAQHERAAAARIGPVRVIEIEGVDLQPCGGTHVANTAEIGAVVVTRIEKIEKKKLTSNMLLILFATLIPALVAGIQFLERRDTEISGASEDLAASVQEIALDLKDIVRATAQLHYGLARAPELDTRDQAACSAFLADVLNEYPQYTGILTIKPSGDLFCDSLRSGRTMNVADRRYFQNALNAGNPLAVEAAFGRLTGTAVLQIAYAARDKMGELKFILLASLDLDKTMQSRSRTLPRKNAVIALVDNKGTVLTWHPDTENLRGRSIAGSPLFRFAREQTAGAVREDLEFGGVSRIWAVSTLPEFPEVGLHVVVGVSKQDLLAAANRNLYQALAILLAVWLLVFGGAWVLARGVMERGLAEEMRIRELNEQLEQRVLERTARLESANQELNREIAERSRAEAELRIAAIAFDSQEGMMVTDAHGVILRVNRAFAEETGYSAEDVVGRKRTMLTSGREDAALYDAMWETVQRSGTWQGEVWDRRKNGEVYPVWLTISAVKGQGGLITNYVATHIDITQRKAVADQLHKLAFYDPLTQLPNRRLLLDRLGHVLAGSTRSRNQGAIMFIDLDNFKALNDTQGHDVGDRLLAEVAQRLKSSVRRGDTVARLGGDEFVVMVQDLAADSMVVAQVEAVAGKILAALDCPYRLVFDAEFGRRNALNYHCTASIGITLFGAHSANVDELLKQADLAMYQAKDSGRNAIRFFDPEMQAAITSRVALEADLRRSGPGGAIPALLPAPGRWRKPSPDGRRSLAPLAS
jgi:diguanylate cyclase (GGDEF)-like protein/PAS domain S-box-containing protein